MHRRRGARRTTSRTRTSTAKPESRDVRHILIAEKDANGQVDFAKSKAEADRLYAELQNGADFAALAKENSADTGSARDGGKSTVNRGQTVPEFDKTAFELKHGRDLAARQDDVRLPHHRGPLADPEGHGDAVRQGQGVDQGHAAPAEEERAS